MMMTTAVTRVASPRHQSSTANALAEPSVTRSRSARHRHTASAIAAAPLQRQAAARLPLAATLAVAACLGAVACAVAGHVGTVTPPAQAVAAVAVAVIRATAVVVAVALQVRAAVVAVTSTSPHNGGRACRGLETPECPAATAAVTTRAPAMIEPAVGLVAVVTVDDEVVWTSTGVAAAPHAVTVAAKALLPTMG